MLHATCNNQYIVAFAAGDQTGQTPLVVNAAVGATGEFRRATAAPASRRGSFRSPLPASRKQQVLALSVAIKQTQLDTSSLTVYIVSSFDIWLVSSQIAAADHLDGASRFSQRIVDMFTSDNITR